MNPQTLTDAGARAANDEKLAAIRTSLEKNPRQMVVLLARQHGVPELDVVRCLPADTTTELDGGRCEEIIRGLEGLGHCWVIVNNGSVTMEGNGPFTGFSTMGPFLNVQNDLLDLHIMTSKLAHAFAVTKPGHLDGVITESIQFFNCDGASAFKVFSSFGQEEPAPEKREQFRLLVEKFALS